MQLFWTTPSNYLLIFIFICVLFNLLQPKFKKNNAFLTAPVSSDEFIVSIKSLDLIIMTYKKIKLDNKLNGLIEKFDINPESQFNSIKTYEKELHRILIESTKEIIKDHLSENMKNILLVKYFTIDSLTFYIHTTLKGE